MASVVRSLLVWSALVLGISGCVEPELTLGVAPFQEDFLELSEGGDVELEMGPQGLAMFEGLGLRATGIDATESPSADDWELTAWLGDVQLGHEEALRWAQRPGPDGELEVVGLRIVLQGDPPPGDVWDREVRFDAWMVGDGDVEVEGTWTFTAVRP